MADKIYIAGPMRGYPQFNFPAFDEAYHSLVEQGFIPISPADLDRVHEGWIDFPPEDVSPNLEMAKRCIGRDVAAIMECQAIYLMKGWENSSGAKVELALAAFLGLGIYYEDYASTPRIAKFIGVSVQDSGIRHLPITRRESPTKDTVDELFAAVSGIS